MQKLKVTDTKTGQVWIDDNHPHSWKELCLFIMERYDDFHLIYCDIECLAKGQTWLMTGISEQWYMLDEIGRYEPMPEEFKVEEL
jgi:hypothetical protein